MGVYDIYGEAEAQLKVGPCILKKYKEGDIVRIRDGAYIAYEGIVVIKNGIFVGLFEDVYNKWGGKMIPSDIIDPQNPINPKVLGIEP